MATGIDTILSINQASRSYPRDISDVPSFVLREMLLPSWLLKAPLPGSFFALRDVNFSLRKGQKLGVIGAHRSGKSTLAGIASGIFRPTSGSVTAQGSRLLINRPTAGFKPTLTLMENLYLRASLAGLHGEFLDTVLEKTLSRCGMMYSEMQTPMGNLSPYIVKQLGMTLLLELPADLLVIDEISSAGIGDARWATRGLLQEKIDSSTALIISSDVNFVQEVAKESVLLHHGRVYGPFSVEQAIEYFNQLPEDDVLSGLPDTVYDPKKPPIIRSQPYRRLPTDRSIDEDPDPYDHREGDIEREAMALTTPPIKTPPWKILGVKVDGEDFRHSLFSLIRRPGDLLSVSVEMVSLRNQKFSGGLFSMFGGNSGLEVGRFYFEINATPITANQKTVLGFDLTIPDWHEDFYGLSFCPHYREKHLPIEHRMKILIFGVGEKKFGHRTQTLEIRNSTFDRKN